MTAPPSAHSIGWDEDWQRTLTAVVRPETGTLARVVRVNKGACDVLVPTGDRLVSAIARWSVTSVRAGDDEATIPATGDWVLLTPFTGSQARAPWAVREVLPRRTAVQRLEVSGTSQAQVLAANADVVAVVEGLVPDLDLGRVERLLTLAWSSGGRPVVVLTKADLHPDPQQAVDQVTAIAVGCEVVPVAAPEGVGLDRVRSWLSGNSTLALLGASGVGKSTLVNALVQTPVMSTRSLGAEHKGRHTTVTRELHLTPGGGAVLDTPGLRSVGLHGAEDLDSVFTDVAALADQCRFPDCAHTVEPGCAVIEAIEDGTLAGRRLESWRSLQREADYQARRADARLREEWTRELKARAKSYRRHHPKRP
jgi:ribosome biogenesis GTPase / thiamine phosphate phosphatase